MSFLIVGSATVPVATSTPPSREVVEVGDRSTGFDGSPRGTVTARKRVWTVVTAPMLRSDADALEVQLNSGPPVSCSGDLLGATLSCWPMVKGWHPVATPGSHKVVIEFTLSES